MRSRINGGLIGPYVPSTSTSTGVNRSAAEAAILNSAGQWPNSTSAVLGSVPNITNIVVTDAAYNNLDDTAITTAGAYIKIIGSGFSSTAVVYINGVLAASTYVSANEIRSLIVSGGTLGGTASIMVFNGAAGAVYLTGVSYSNAPTWVTSSGSLATVYETTAVNNTVQATGDAPVTYYIDSGNLPDGVTLNSTTGVLSGTAPASSGNITYNFTIRATDAQQQDSYRAFSLTINTDTLTWTSPATDGASYNLTQNLAMSNVSVSAAAGSGSAVTYSANALPTGLTLTNGVISGTPTVVASNVSLITATATSTTRSSTRTINWTVIIAGDQYWKYASLLLSANAAVTGNSFITDASISNSQITVVGDTRAQKFNPFQEGFYSIYYGTRSDYVSTPAVTNLTTFTGDFTFEAWVCPTDTSNSEWSLWDSRQNGATANAMVFLISPLASPVSGQGRLHYFNGASNFGTGIVYYNRWSHIAYVRAGTTMTFYINGVASGTSTVSGTQTATATTNPVYIGGKDAGAGGQYGTVGYISNFRIVNGTAVYTSNFTPSTAPLTAIANTVLLVGSSNRLVDNSRNNYALTRSGTITVSAANAFGNVAPTSVTVPSTTGYSMYFDGTGDYISIGNNPAFDFGTGDFTVEFWLYAINMPNTAGIVGKKTGDATNGWQIYHNTSVANTRLSIRTTLQNDFSSTASWTLNVWDHWAVTRSGTTIRWFKNGVLDNTGSNSFNLTDNTVTYIGYSQTWGGYFTGYISNLRIVTGQALYTATFTPSTTPLTAVAPTGTIAYSNYFDGNGDYLGISDNPVLQFGTGNFTVECWVNQPAQSGVHNTVVGKWGTGFGTTGDWALRTRLSNATQFAVTLRNTSGWYDIQTNISVSDNAWHHLAVVRDSSTTIKLYIDGLLRATQAVSATDIVGSAAVMSVGGNYATNTNEVASTGYVSNLRITRGQALYTANFTPATSSLTTTSQGATAADVVLLTSQAAGLVDNSRFAHNITRFGDATTTIFNPFYANATIYTSLLTAQSSTVVDNGILATPIVVAGDARPTQNSPFVGALSTQTLTGTEGSAYFDGTGDYLNALSSVPTFGTGAYTVEFWIYPVSLAATHVYVRNNTTGGWQVYYDSTSGLGIAAVGSAGFLFAAVGSLVTYQWQHVAICRNSTATNDTRNFVNGVLKATGTDSNNWTINSPLTIGADSSGTNAFNGYISNVRMIRGTALYTSAFVPGYAPLTAVTNTQLLTLQNRVPHNNSAFLDNSVFNNVVSRAGNANNGLFSPYGNNWSVYFDGASYITPAAGLATAMGGGFATNIISIEMFVFPTNLNNGSYENSFIGAYQAVAANGRWHFYHPRSATSTTTLGFVYTTGTGSQNFLVTTASPLIQNQWNHIAVTIDATTAASSTITIFANGSLIQTWTGQNLSTQTTYYSAPLIGGPNSSFVSQFAGYISNVRILKGALAYTGSYTVPTGSLQNTSATVLNACQSNRYIDVSINNFALTRSGATVTVQKFSPFGTVTVSDYYSGYFNGSADYLQLPYSSSFNCPTSFTIEFWAYPISRVTTYPTVFSNYSTYAANGLIGIFCGHNSTSTKWSIAFNGVDGVLVSTSNIVYNSWVHIAIVRNGTAMAMYVNGVSESTSTQSATLAGTANSIWIGAAGDNPGVTYYNGYVSNLRFVKGQALYTGTFTPSTTPLTTTSQDATASNVSLLTCQNNTFIDNSPNYFTITAATATVKTLPVSPFTPTTSLTATDYSAGTFGGSMYFDGTGDYLSMPSNSALIIGQNSATVEFWIYPTSVSGYQRLVTSSVGGFVTGDFIIRFNNGTFLAGEAITNINSATLPSINQWNHVAWVGTTGTAQALYINGLRVGTAGAYNITVSIQYIGGYYTLGPAEYANGYMSDVRVVKGAALYTGSFFPGTSPATPTASVGATTYPASLLLTGTTGGAVDATRTVDLETVGDARRAQFGPYNGLYYSNYFDGTGDYLSFSTLANAQTAFPGTGAFTIEAWVNPATTTWMLVSGLNTGAGALWWEVYHSSTAFNLVIGNYGVASASASTSSLVTTNTWTHVVVQRRTDNTIDIYYNGIAQSVTNGFYGGYIGASLTPTAIPKIGGGGFYTAGAMYISNFRFTSSRVYTSNFTPSTTPLTAVANTSLLTCQSNRFVDNSTNALTLTSAGDAAVRTQNPFQVNTGVGYYFDGTGDQLMVASPNQLTNFGTGDFTVEFWIYLNAVPAGTQGVFTNPTAFYINFRSSGTIGLTDSTTVYATTASALTAGSWFHVAVVRSSGSSRIYTNGVGGTAVACAVNWTNTGAAYIGGDANGTINGYITDFRITRGYARYTATFTPPTAPIETK